MEEKRLKQFTFYDLYYDALKEILCDRGSRAYLSVKSAAGERIKVIALLRRVAGKLK